MTRTSPSVAPHDFKPMKGARDLCEACYRTEEQHPLRSINGWTDNSWVVARPIGDYGDSPAGPRRTRWGRRRHLLRIAISNALDWL